ncbi:MAG: SPASM domain-containing protein, partial [Syntrophaceae bacterium]|nr:SPASM domain-containing protein [Syntrophaceae bacterium]
MNISLDGYGKYHDIYRVYDTKSLLRISDKERLGSWDKIAANIDLLIMEGIVPNINTTISAESASGLGELAEWVFKRDLKVRFGFVRNLDCDWTDGQGRREKYEAYADLLADAFEKMFRQLELPSCKLHPNSITLGELNFERPSTATICGIGHNHVIIKEDGNLASCSMNVSTESFPASDDLLSSIRQTYPHSPDERSSSLVCLSCQWFPVCVGGCPVANERFNGAPYTQSPLCKYWKYIIPRYAEFY